MSTDLDVLPADRVVTRRDGYLVVRSPSNPGHWWGNFLAFDDAPGPGDGARGEAAFAAAFAGVAGIGHRAFTWDRTDGEEGAAQTELVARGYRLERMVGLTAAPDEIRTHSSREPGGRDPCAGSVAVG